MRKISLHFYFSFYTIGLMGHIRLIGHIVQIGLIALHSTLYTLLFLGNTTHGLNVFASSKSIRAYDIIITVSPT